MYRNSVITWLERWSAPTHLATKYAKIVERCERRGAKPVQCATELLYVLSHPCESSRYPV